MCQNSTELTGELTGVEAQMVAARADHRRVLELFDGAERGAVNTRMVNLVLSAELELGTDAVSPRAGRTAMSPSTSWIELKQNALLVCPFPFLGQSSA